jgi:hypothetical protein
MRPSPQGPKLLLTSKDTATALSISERMLAELRARGNLTPIRLPGRGKAARSLRYHLKDLESWIEAQKAGPKSD